MVTVSEESEPRALPSQPGARVRASLTLSVVIGVVLVGNLILFTAGEHGEGLGWPVALLSVVFVRFLAPLGGIVAVVLAIVDPTARQQKRLLIKPFVLVGLVLLVTAWMAFDSRFAPRGPLG